jgi:hypothetical protein
MTWSCRICGRTARLALIAAIAVIASASFASAQSASAPALTAAFLYSFAKFTEWPADVIAAGDPLVLCVVNDGAVVEMLADLTKGRSIDGHALVVLTMKPDWTSLPSCRLLFTSGLDVKRSAALLESVAGKPVLTVSDSDKFTQLGGVAQLVVDKGTMGFSVNLDAMHRARILLSSKLLSLARIVKDTSYVR